LKIAARPLSPLYALVAVGRREPESAFRIDLRDDAVKSRGHRVGRIDLPWSVGSGNIERVESAFHRNLSMKPTSISRTSFRRAGAS